MKEQVSCSLSGKSSLSPAVKKCVCCTRRVKEVTARVYKHTSRTSSPHAQPGDFSLMMRRLTLTIPKPDYQPRARSKSAIDFLYHFHRPHSAAVDAVLGSLFQITIILASKSSIIIFFGSVISPPPRMQDEIKVTLYLVSPFMAFNRRTLSFLISSGNACFSRYS